MDRSIVLQNLLDAAAIVQPVEGGAAEVLAVLIDGPTTDSKPHRQTSDNAVLDECTGGSQTGSAEGRHLLV
jgi:hypothetical protein